VSPVVDILLILALLIAALAWVLIYFFVVERWLQRHIGNIFGVTIGKSRLMERRQDAHTQFYASGWKIVAPQSAGCMFDIFIWSSAASPECWSLAYPSRPWRCQRSTCSISWCAPSKAATTPTSAIVCSPIGRGT